MTRLKSIDIAGWKSIRKTETPIELGPLNVLIGANGAGKSNLFSFLRLLRELVDQRLQLHIARSGGADTLLYYGSKQTKSIETRCVFELDQFEAELNLSLVHSPPDSLLIADERWIYPNANASNGKTITLTVGGNFRESTLNGEAALVDANAKAIRQFLNTIRVYHIDDTSSSAKIRLTNSLEDDLHLYGDGGNLAVMLYVYQRQYPMIYGRIRRAIQKILPGFDDFVLEPERLNPRKLFLKWKRQGSDYILGPHQLSDGTLRAVVLITLLLQSEKDLPSLLVLDEPEMGLHPHAIEILSGMIRSASFRTQVIVATQSPALLDYFDPEEIMVVDCLDGESKFSRLSSNDLGDWLSRYSIGELWEKNVVGGGPLR